jgi:hypothetical protein
MTNALQLTKGTTPGFYYTADRRYRVSSLTQATVSRVKVQWSAVEFYGTPAAVTVAEATTLSTLRVRLAAHIAKATS